MYIEELKGLGLIIESSETNTFQMINEALSDQDITDGVLARCRGTFATMDVMNDNAHRYDRKNYESVLQPYLLKVQRKAALGALEHQKETTIKLTTCNALRVDKIEWDQATNSYVGEISILDTEHGRILHTILKSGSPLFLSSRALGKVQPDGTVILRKFITYDAVGEPGFGDNSGHPAEFQLITESLAFLDFSKLSDDDVLITEALSDDNSNLNVIDMNKDEVVQLIKDTVPSIIGDLDQKIADAVDKKFESIKSELGSVNESVIADSKQEILNIVSDYIAKELIPNLEEKIKNSGTSEDEINALVERLKPQLEDLIKGENSDKFDFEAAKPAIAKMISDAVSSGKINTLEHVDSYIVQELLPSLKEVIDGRKTIDDLITEAKSDDTPLTDDPEVGKPFGNFGTPITITEVTEGDPTKLRINFDKVPTNYMLIEKNEAGEWVQFVNEGFDFAKFVKANEKDALKLLKDHFGDEITGEDFYHMQSPLHSKAADKLKDLLDSGKLKTVDADENIYAVNESVEFEKIKITSDDLLKSETMKFEADTEYQVVARVNETTLKVIDGNGQEVEISSGEGIEFVNEAYGMIYADVNKSYEFSDKSASNKLSDLRKNTDLTDFLNSVNVITKTNEEVYLRFFREFEDVTFNEAKKIIEQSLKGYTLIPVKTYTKSDFKHQESIIYVVVDSNYTMVTESTEADRESMIKAIMEAPDNTYKSEDFDKMDDEAVKLIFDKLSVNEDHCDTREEQIDYLIGKGYTADQFTDLSDEAVKTMYEKTEKFVTESFVNESFQKDGTYIVLGGKTKGIEVFTGTIKENIDAFENDGDETDAVHISEYSTISVKKLKETINDEPAYEVTVLSLPAKTTGWGGRISAKQGQKYIATDADLFTDTDSTVSFVNESVEQVNECKTGEKVKVGSKAGKITAVNDDDKTATVKFDDDSEETVNQSDLIYESDDDHVDESKLSDEDLLNVSDIVNEAKQENNAGVLRTRYDNEPFVKNMPTQFEHVWESLSDESRTVVANQASMRKINNLQDGFNFWNSRDFDALGHAGFVNEGLEEEFKNQQNEGQLSFKERYQKSIRATQGTRQFGNN